MTDAISVRGLRKCYKDFTLQDVSITLPWGQVMGFVGENGAGKTTTIKAMLQVINRDAGDIQLLGLPLTGNEKQLKEQIGVVLAEGQFHDCLTLAGIRSILKNIYSTWDDDLFARLSKQFSLPEKKPYKDFSSGTKRKASIVAALAHHPRLLILDEPTSGLDPVVREEMLDLFLDFMQKEDHAILLSSHITGDLDKIADSITFLHQGQIIFSRGREDLSEKMGLLKCGTAAFQALDKSHVLRIRKSAFDVEALVDDRPYYAGRYPDLLLQPATTEEIMLFYVRGEKL